MLLAVIAISATVGWLLERGSSSPHKTSTAAGLNANSASSGGHQPAAARHRTRHALPHGWAYIAVPRRRIAQLTVYRSPRGGHVRLVLPRRSAIGVPLTLLVHQVTKNWVQTYLPVRPDRVTGWIKRRELNLKTTSYELHAELGHHRLLLLVADHVVRTFSVGVGKSVTPTPSGRYFITELLKQPDPAGAYGPYAFGLSAFSGVLTHFGRGGNGQIGIHGTDQPQLLGSDVSHGCIRMRNSDVLWLVHRLPLGTPVVIDRT
jgi:lipoprotein-anchoring transpeptidase ErfK/SrfK